ncbi:MAG: magnesium transporter, partial [Acholeplasmataceae bacterium]|nr:magnesium transporter [Acholeplasmataceae bacterium]
FLVIPAFEATLSQVFALVLFQPMVLAMAGNIGTQSLAVTILGIHKDELSTDSDRRRYFRKELMIVLLNAIMIAILGFLVVTTFAFLTKQVDKSGNPIPPYNLGLVVGASLFAGMTVSGMMGTSLPLLLTRHKVDADNAGGPVLTTLSDLIALFIYYLVAAIMLFVL